MSKFTCPRCGGHTFGTTLEHAPPPEHYRVRTYNCSSDENGRPLSMTNVEWEIYRRTGVRPIRGKPCRWRGEEFPGEE